jgi:hypothetical protein
MKQITATLCLLCGLLAAAQAQTQTQTAGVGIQTENPKGVLHIDAAANNPSTGNISDTQATDDVVIDTLGRVGAGVTAPKAKLHIYSATGGGALRIADGTQGNKKVLVSDADGKASWGDPPGVGWYAALRSDVVHIDYDSTLAGHTPLYDTPTLANYSLAPLVSSTGEGGSADAAAGTVTVPFTGKYLITASVHFMSNRTRAGNPYGNPSHYKGTAILQVTRGAATTSRWTYSTWGGRSGDGTVPTASAILDLNKGDILSLALDRRLKYAANRALPFVFIVEFIQ